MRRFSSGDVARDHAVSPPATGAELKTIDDSKRESERAREREKWRQRERIETDWKRHGKWHENEKVVEKTRDQPKSDRPKHGLGHERGSSGIPAI